MKGYEIVKKWNEVKGTAYEGSSFDTLSKAVDGMIEKRNEEVVTNYFEDMLKGQSKALYSYIKLSALDDWRIKKAENKNNESFNVLNVLSNEIVKVLGNNLVEQINNAIESKLNKFVEEKVVTKVIEYKGSQNKVEGITHEEFDTIVKFVSMKEPVMLVGPAGSGKNVIVEQVSKALNLDFYFSNAVIQKYDLTGYGDANGEYVKTQFYDAFAKGGLFFLDEVDASCPEALIVMNSAIANGYFDFPVLGRIYAHPDFRVVANANTYGTGATMEYVGRNQLDGATLNRFAVVEIGYSPKIEDAICEDKEILKFCREFRKICDKNGVHHIVSYREISRLNKMINVAGLDKVKAIKTCLVKGLEKDTLRMICNEMKSIEYKSVLEELVNSL